MIFINIFITMLGWAAIFLLASISYVGGMCFLSDACEGITFKLFAAFYSLCTLIFVVSGFVGVFLKVWGWA